MLFRSDVAASLRQGVEAEPIVARGRQALTDAGFGVDYFHLVAGETLTPIETSEPNARIVAAARMGSVRLLDNIGVIGG